ncbi:hypothetical protein H1C71_031391, partial [Ictidomys tridecemlineatus]
MITTIPTGFPLNASPLISSCSLELPGNPTPFSCSVHPPIISCLQNYHPFPLLILVIIAVHVNSVLLQKSRTCLHFTHALTPPFPLRTRVSWKGFYLSLSLLPPLLIILQPTVLRHSSIPTTVLALFLKKKKYFLVVD